MMKVKITYRIFIFILSVVAIAITLRPPLSYSSSVTFELKNKDDVEFGPFFLPLSSSLESVCINYFTSEPSPTEVYFSMNEDIDWARSDKDVVNFHQMNFYNVEEETEYRFTIPDDPGELVDLSGFRTVPYGDVYDFDFTIARMDSDLQWDEIPHFLILLSGESEVDMQTFRDYYFRNSDILSQTILIPVFDMDLGDELMTLSYNGVFRISYRKLNLIVVFNDIDDITAVEPLFSSDWLDVNYLVIGNVDETLTAQMIEKYQFSADKIFSYNELDGSEMITVDDEVMVNIASDNLGVISEFMGDING